MCIKIVTQDIQSIIAQHWSKVSTIGSWIQMMRSSLHLSYSIYIYTIEFKITSQSMSLGYKVPHYIDF